MPPRSEAHTHKREIDKPQPQNTETVEIVIDQRMNAQMIVDAFNDEFFLPKKLQPDLEALAKRLALQITRSNFQAYVLHMGATKGTA